VALERFPEESISQEPFDSYARSRPVRLASGSLLRFIRLGEQVLKWNIESRETSRQQLVAVEANHD
jgi:hypothetical protein